MICGHPYRPETDGTTPQKGLVNMLSDEKRLLDLLIKGGYLNELSKELLQSKELSAYADGTDPPCNLSEDQIAWELENYNSPDASATIAQIEDQILNDDYTNAPPEALIPEVPNRTDPPEPEKPKPPWKDLPISFPTGFKRTDGMIYPMCVDTLFNRYPGDISSRDYLIDNLIRKNTLTVIIAASKCKKSFLIQELALSICCGTTFLDKPVIQGKVLLVDPELRPESLAERLRGLISTMPGVYLNLVKENLTIITLRGAEKKDYINNLTTYLEKCRSHGIDFDAIIIDSVYMLIDGDENSSTQMCCMMQGLIGIADKYGAVFCTSHVSKATAAGKSGYEVADRSVGSNIVGRSSDNLISITRCDSNVSDSEFFKVEYVLREDKSPDPTYIMVDESGDMPYHKVIDDPSMYGLTVHNSRAQERKDAQQSKVAQLKQIINELQKTKGVVQRSDIESRMGISSNTARSLISQAGYDCTNGVVTPKQ